MSAGCRATVGDGNRDLDHVAVVRRLCRMSVYENKNKIRNPNRLTNLVDGCFLTESLFVPIMVARIRSSLDDSSLLRLVTVSLESLSEIQMPTTTAASTNSSEITPCVDDVAVAINNKNFNSEERFNDSDFLLKRSYLFGFERSLASERMVTEAVTEAQEGEFLEQTAVSVWLIDEV